MISILIICDTKNNRVNGNTLLLFCCNWCPFLAMWPYTCFHNSFFLYTTLCTMHYIHLNVSSSFLAPWKMKKFMNLEAILFNLKFIYKCLFFVGSILYTFIRTLIIWLSFPCSIHNIIISQHALCWSHCSSCIMRPGFSFTYCKSWFSEDYFPYHICQFYRSK